MFRLWSLESAPGHSVEENRTSLPIVVLSLLTRLLGLLGLTQTMRGACPSASQVPVTSIVVHALEAIRGLYFTMLRRLRTFSYFSSTFCLSKGSLTRNFCVAGTNWKVVLHTKEMMKRMHVRETFMKSLNRVTLCVLWRFASFAERQPAYISACAFTWQP